MGFEDRTGTSDRVDKLARRDLPKQENATPVEPEISGLIGKSFKVGILADRGKIHQLIYGGSVPVKTLDGKPTAGDHTIASGVTFSFISSGTIEEGIKLINEGITLRYASEKVGIYREWLAHAISLYRLYRDVDIGAVEVDGNKVPFTDEAVEEAWRREGFLPELVNKPENETLVAIRLADEEPHASGIALDQT